MTMAIIARRWPKYYGSAFIHGFGTDGKRIDVNFVKG